MTYQCTACGTLFSSDDLQDAFANYGWEGNGRFEFECKNEECDSGVEIEVEFDPVFCVPMANYTR